MIAKCRSLLNELSPAAKQTGLYRVLLAEIASRSEAWAEAAILNEELALNYPDMPGFYIQWAFTTRRSSGIDAAQNILEKAVRRFPNVATIHYNLGCYACVQGELDTAKSHLRNAFKLDADFIDTGLEDEDL